MLAWTNMSDVEVLSAAKKTAKSLKRRHRKRESSSDESSSGSGSEDEQQQQLRRQRRRGAQNDEQQREAKSAEEMNLESLVFGAEFTVIGDGSGRRKKKSIVLEANEKTVKSELADNFVERKPAWQDDDDQVEK